MCKTKVITRVNKCLTPASPAPVRVPRVFWDVLCLALQGEAASSRACPLQVSFLQLSPRQPLAQHPGSNEHL